MAPNYKIAVIQLYPKPMQAANNYAKAEKFVRSAASQGAHLAVLPEYHLTNWLPRDPKFYDLCTQWKTYLQKYQDLAKECNICIVPGTLVQTKEGKDEESREMENVSYFIDNRGEVLGSYTKKNLWGSIERDHLVGSGRDVHPVFDTPLGKVGILICWDLAFPEAWRELIAQGAKLVVVPTFWTLSDCTEEGLKHNANAEQLFMDSCLTARAFENTCAIAFANAGGPSGKGYAGLSQVTVPYVGPLTRIGSCNESMAIADVDMRILEAAEENYQVRSDMESIGWHYDYRHDKPKEKL